MAAAQGVEDKDLGVDSDLEFDEDDLFNSSNYREQRLEELKRQAEHSRDLREIDHGKYTEIFDEPEVIRTSANEKRCVIHFYHRNFTRCKIMDKHLEEIAPKYYHTRFFRVFVENVPWLVEKLGVKVLPCVIVFVDGVTKDRIIGFEELGNADDFATSALEMRLKVSGVIGGTDNNNPLRSMYATASESRDPASDEDDNPGGGTKRKIRDSARKEEDDDDFDL
ncbi:hypothetical protein M408DRAFT_333249 [Serendipita vermifera MAFF 305830]|uniref:Thioredoxin domain-containing protein n=1 Tax=Serendipita vermifera MAFF 305830 TaxID=933852 RepID=A0A0C2WWS8_SERVB|nr:hypothetical protein M408DRAFT_333249 [Serendipita vermifera MAFF 305830]